MPHAGRLGVHDAGLRAHVQLDMRRVPTREREGAEVAHDERVGIRRVERLQVRRQRGHIVGAHERVHGHVGLRAGRMSAGHGVGHVIEREVRGTLAQPEAVAGEVHRVRPEAHRRLQLRPPAGRREEFGGMCRLISHAPYCSAGQRCRNPSLKPRARKKASLSRVFQVPTGKLLLFESFPVGTWKTTTKKGRPTGPSLLDARNVLDALPLVGHAGALRGVLDNESQAA